MSFKERRRAKRVEKKLPITVLGGPEKVAGETLNISTNGVYFTCPYFIEPLTKVHLSLVIPGEEDSRDQVESEGVVVRVEPERKDASVSEYNIAVFFNRISDPDHSKLESFIQRCLE